jgi:hypothetical protein
MNLATVLIHHVFLSLRCAMNFMAEICSVLCRMTYLENTTPRVSLRLLHVCIDSFHIFSEYVSYFPRFLRWFPHSLMLKYFLCILWNTQKEWRIRGKKLSLSTMPGDFKGTAFQKKLNIYWPRMNSFPVFFFGYLLKNCSLRIWRIRMAKNEGKLSTYQLIRVQHKKIF